MPANGAASTLVTSDVTDGVATILLDNPSSANALSAAMITAIQEALLEAEADDDVRAIVLGANGRGFSAGGDVKAMAGVRPEDKARSITRSGRLIETVLAVQVPIVAAVHGYAVGAGISLALASDLIVAEAGTSFRLAFRNVGLLPDLGLHHFLERAVGPWRAKHLIWTGGSFTAEEAHDLGFVTEVAPPGEALAVATALARQLADGPRHAIAYTKAVLAQSQRAAIVDVLQTEGLASSILRGTPDHHEGVQAFRDKRPPRFGRPAEDS
jgi:2-(1,2-epoxy-1,2-dihydrophenyl)acetyl-CoA isomerase